MALIRLAFGVSTEILAATLVVALESSGFRVGVPFFPPVAIAALQAVLRETLSQRLLVWTNRVWLLFWMEFGTGVLERCVAPGSVSA